MEDTAFENSSCYVNMTKDTTTNSTTISTNPTPHNLLASSNKKLPRSQGSSNQLHNYIKQSNTPQFAWMNQTRITQLTKKTFTSPKTKICAGYSQKLLDLYIANQALHFSISPALVIWQLSREVYQGEEQ